LAPFTTGSDPFTAVSTLGNVNKAVRTCAVEPLHVDTPEGQGLVASSRACEPLNAHWNSVSPLQLLSVVAIDPVESTMMATFHDPEPVLLDVPCMDAVAVAFTARVFTPNKAMKAVLILVLFVTTTALAEVVLVHVDPTGISMLTHRVNTEVATVPPE
jgi:hypothetical protein